MDVFEQIQKLAFTYTDRQEPVDLGCLTSAERLSAVDILSLPKDTKDLSQLRCTLADLFILKLDGNYTKLEVNCDIKRDTFSRALNFRRNRNITYPFLEKFCIGAKLSLEEARSLFSLAGYTLNDEVRRDKILILSIAAGSDIVEYNEDLIKCGYASIFGDV